MQNPAANRVYLLNTAETIQHVLLPQLQDQAHSRALDCLHTLARIAADLDTPPPASEALAQGRLDEAADTAGAQLIRTITQASVPEGRRFDTAQLEAYLRGHPLGGEALRVLSARALPGGRSKQTILVTQEGARILPRDFIIRQDWASSVVNSSVYSEFEVLHRLHAKGIRVPQPLFLECEATALGARFIAVTRLSGKVLGDLFTPPPTTGPVLELAEQMGRVHALPAADFETLPGIRERDYTAEQLRVSLAAFRAIIDRFDAPASPLIQAALAWLDAGVDRVVAGPRTLVHGDVGFHNNLCDGDHLSAILDWELAHIGSPALDLGHLKSAVEDSMEWSQFMAAYHAAGGPPLNAFVVDWYSLFSSVWFFHMMLQARAGLMSGQLHDMEITFVCAHFGPAVRARIFRKLAAALQAYG